MTDPSTTSPPVHDPVPPATETGPSPAAGGPQRQRRLIAAAVVVVVAVVVIIVVLVSGGSTPPSGFKNANPGVSTKVAGANATALTQISAYNTQITDCTTNIGCTEQADRKLGDQLHVYANYVGTLRQTGAAGKVVSATLNTAQVTANTMEILGDAQPTKANYDKVLHNFDLQGQIGKMTAAINNLSAILNG